jgi:hypothetical protein
MGKSSAKAGTNVSANHTPKSTPYAWRVKPLAELLLM